jgi:hypothetical protein
VNVDGLAFATGADQESWTFFNACCPAFRSLARPCAHLSNCCWWCNEPVIELAQKFRT